MTIYLRIMLIVFSLLTSYYLLKKIRKSQLQIEDSLFWIAFSFSIALLSIIPAIAIKMSEIIGIESPANFVFLVIIFILLIKVFRLSIKISQLEHNVRILAQEIAIYESNELFDVKTDENNAV